MSPPTPCCVCNTRYDPRDLVTLTLTEEEKAMVLETTKEPAPDQMLYCKPCMALLNNRVQGAALLKGVVQVELNALGVPDAERWAQKWHSFWMKATEKKG